MTTPKDSTEGDPMTIEAPEREAPAPETGPCHVCGEPAPPAAGSYAVTLTPYYLCPPEGNLACVDRGLAKRARDAARRSGDVAAAVVEGTARARQEDAPETLPETARPARPSQAREDILGGAGRAKPGDV